MSRPERTALDRFRQAISEERTLPGNPEVATGKVLALWHAYVTKGNCSNLFLPVKTGRANRIFRVAGQRQGEILSRRMKADAHALHESILFPRSS